MCFSSMSAFITLTIASSLCQFLIWVYYSMSSRRWYKVNDCFVVYEESREFGVSFTIARITKVPLWGYPKYTSIEASSSLGMAKIGVDCCFHQSFRKFCKVPYEQVIEIENCIKECQTLVAEKCNKALCSESNDEYSLGKIYVNSDRRIIRVTDVVDNELCGDVYSLDEGICVQFTYRSCDVFDDDSMRVITEADFNAIQCVQKQSLDRVFELFKPIKAKAKDFPASKGGCIMTPYGMY